nr:DUF839 domain-containing protein [Oceanococcus sp. HetDA_MAG_MS8]
MSSNFAATLPRRDFLRYVLLTGAAAGAGSMLNACGGGGQSPSRDALPGDNNELFIPSGPLANIGPLQGADANDVLLPPGFSSRIVARNNDTDLATVSGTGYTWHPFPDGGATYPRENGGWIYVSNSEVPGVPLGGAGALVFDPDGSVVDAYSILTGTTMNCAGGQTPWNTWLSCEETPSGQVWECDPYNPGQGIAKPALGLFSHEAAAIDPINKVVYLTEDAGDGRFYRWVADAADIDPVSGRLAMEQGRLQVLNLEGYEDGGYESDDALMRTLRPVTWVDANSPDQPQGTVRGPGSIFDGGEGLWYYELPEEVRSIPQGGTVPTRGLVFWTCKGDNRVWALDIENQLAELIFDNSQISPEFADVDNLTVSPAGDILVAEDGAGVRIMVVVPNQPSKVLVQLGSTHTASEICGPAFSPDGSRLYFSSQRGPDGLGAPSGTTFEILIPEEFRA